MLKAASSKTSAVPDDLEKATGSQPEATMFDTDQQFRQEIEIDELVAVTSDDTKGNTVKEGDDKRAKLS